MCIENSGFLYMSILKCIGIAGFAAMIYHLRHLAAAAKGRVLADLLSDSDVAERLQPAWLSYDDSRQRPAVRLSRALEIASFAASSAASA